MPWMLTFRALPSVRVAKTAKPKRGLGNLWLISAVVVTVAVVAGVYVWFFPKKSGLNIDPVLQPVVRETFEANVLEQGEVRSSDNREYECEVKSRYGETSVRWVIKEGTKVKPGDVLVELDSSRLDEALEEQQIEVKNAEKRVQTAKSNLEAARIAKQEYLQGKYEELKREIENEIFLAEEEYRQYEEIARFSERLAAKSYITELELDAAKFAVERARNRLELSRIKLRVLETQTRKKEEIKFDSDIAALTTEYSNEQKILATEQKQLDDIKEQLAKCTISVREDEKVEANGYVGEVVYANVFSSRGNSEWVLEEGASVREGQTLIKLPNSSKMEVFAQVNESQIKAVDVGKPVEIKVDALQTDEPLRGEVVLVNNYPEPESWSSGGIKRFGVTIQILDPPRELRSGMNASVSIRTSYQEDVLQVPVQALVERNGSFFCFVKRNQQFEAVSVTVNGTNAKTAWISDGLEEGELVVMGPRQYDVLELPEVAPSGPSPDGPEIREDTSISESQSDGGTRVAEETQQPVSTETSTTPVAVGANNGDAS